MAATAEPEPPEPSTPPPPPAAPASSQERDLLADDGEEDAASASPGTTEVASGRVEGVEGGATGGGDDDDPPSSSSSTKRGKEGARSHDGRFPVRPAPFVNLRQRLRGLFSPRATDIQILVIKLEKQFEMLEVDFERYAFERYGSKRDEEKISVAAKSNRKDPQHPLNNPKLMTEVHFVGRKAIDSSIIELSTLLINRDKFGSITELWLNDNLISDDGAAAISSFLQLPSCSLVELWLGNNRIGPTGTTLIAGALSNNENSKLTCLGLYSNPIGNGGASSLSQMLRRNHSLSTVDVHGCGGRGSGPTVLDGYGCKVVKGSDGTEYVAKVVASIADERDGRVTDHRFLDAIQTFVAFNRIDPTREQVIRGMMASSSGEEGNGASEKQHQTHVSKFLSKLCDKPANERLTEEEKRIWKDCEWKRLYVERERAREAKAALTSQLKLGLDDNFTIDDEEDEDSNTRPSEEKNDDTAEKEHTFGRDLDSEVVQTDNRSWQDIKRGITGSTSSKNKHKRSPAKEQELDLTSDADNQTDGPEVPPQSASDAA